MKKLLTAALLAAACVFSAGAQKLTILHTNDTHSHIDAENGKGGVLQRKAIIDSVRQADKHVLLIDAGDIVQGTLYFNLFKGAVEYPLMDLMGYDVQILGNHEFDNGLESLSQFYPYLKSDRLSANYDFAGTPLEGVFKPYVIKEIEGKKAGIFGLNLDPDGMIAADNYAGMGFKEIVEAANATADFLRKKKHCDLIIAVSHIGYDNGKDSPLVSDPDVARASRNIDIIVGGHSHTLIDPTNPEGYPCRIKNREGKDVLVVQTGRYGAYLGEIKVDLSHPRKADYRLIPVEGIAPERYDPAIVDFLKPYRHVIDSINARTVAVSAQDMANRKQYSASVAFTNLACDMAQWYGNTALDSLHNVHPEMPSHSNLAIMNSGGIRQPWQKGAVSEGLVLSTFPFPNKFVIVEMTGRQLQALLTQVAHYGTQGVSAEVRIAVDPESRQAVGFTVEGSPIEPDKLYYITTIDYLAGGGDYMTTFKEGRIIWTDTADMCAPVMRYVVMQTRQGLPLGLSTESRIVNRVGLPEK